MVFFALFTIGYLAGVLTALYIFPPNSREIEEQEIDALAPILTVKSKKVNEDTISSADLIYT